MNFGWLKKVAPWIGAAATGNVPALVTMAANSVGTALGKKVDADPQAIAEAVAGATPEQLLAVQKEDHDFQTKLQQLGIQEHTDIEKINADDRASARNREIAVRDSTPRVLAYIYTAGFFATLFAYILVGVKGIVMPPGADKALDILLGVMTAMMLGSKEYFFGSSAGSDRKTELLAQAPATDSK